VGLLRLTGEAKGTTDAPEASSLMRRKAKGCRDFRRTGLSQASAGPGRSSAWSKPSLPGERCPHVAGGRGAKVSVRIHHRRICSLALAAIENRGPTVLRGRAAPAREFGMPAGTENLVKGSSRVRLATLDPARGERQPITHLILHLLVRKIVERLQNQHPKHHDRVERLPASATLPHLIRCQHSLYVGTKALSQGTSRSIASSGSPFSAANRSSASNNPNCPIRLRITPSRMRFAQLARRGYFSRYP
jgi:hypothetical protein